MKKPLVSIIVPCYNGEKFIHKLLDSVLAQTYNPIELIVVDDGSKDDSLTVLNRYKKRFKEGDIKYSVIAQENGGLPNAINTGLENFTGEYVNFIDCDDYFSDDSIEKRVNFLEKNKDIDVVWSATNVIDDVSGEIVDVWRDKSNPYRKDLFIDMILHDNYVWPPASKLVRASTYLSLNPGKTILDKVPGQNIQIFLPIYFKGKNVGYIDEPLAYVTARTDSLSRQERTEEQKRKFEEGIRDTFIDTLKRIEMPHEERDKYIAIVEERYRQYKRKITRTVNTQRDELGQLFDYDEQRFRQSYVTNIATADQTQLAAKLIFSSHSLEKSLSNDNFEIGHGFMVAKMLIEMLQTYKSKKYDQNHLAYINTLSVLQAFYNRHEGTEFIEEIENIFGDFLLTIKGCESKIGGADKILLKDKENNQKKNFKELAEGRYAVRTYADVPVDRNDIVEAIEIAMKTPTVCNRQSLHVHEIYDKEVIEKLLEVQGGIAYYDTPPALLLITTDDKGYVGINERNQGYIDGGLFAMSVLYALEYKKLAACPLNTMFDIKQEMTMRGMLGVSDSEKFITFISVGYFNKENQVCKSFRYPAEHILSRIDKIQDYTLQDIEEKQNTEEESLLLKVRKKVRVRTRAKAGVSSVKRAVRVRTRLRNMKLKTAELRHARTIKKADGAILTLTGYFNYGNIIQRYATQEFLRQNRYTFVSYARESMELNEQEQKKYFNTEAFIRGRILRKPFDPSERLSMYVVGSDQVWRNWGYADVTSELGYFFLDFLGDFPARRVSYAASFGQAQLKDAMIYPKFIKYITPFVNKFDAISVREDSAVKIVAETWGVKAKQVVDPTMLLRAKDYSKLIRTSTRKLSTVHPIFAYILARTEDKDFIVKKIAEERGMTVGSLYLEELDVLPPVEQWLKSFRDAKLVVTDSFHGVVFSIINNTPFVVIDNENGGVARITSLLEQFDIKGRLVFEKDHKSIDLSNLEPINWDLVNKKLEVLRKDSGDWLLSALQG